MAPVSMEQLEEMALSMGCVLTPIDKWGRAIGDAVGHALRAREGDFIYQSAALCIKEIPRLAAEQILGPPRAASDSELTWGCDSAAEAASFFRSLLPLSGLQTAGATRAIQRASEPVIRVVATMMGGAEMRHVTARNGSEMLYINFLYVLMGEMGDLHPPKDPERREIALSQEETTELRQTILTDVLALGQQGAKLSPGWWRQLGDESSARVTEAHLANLEAMRTASAAAALSGAPMRVATRDTYEVRAILGVQRRGWLRVAWEGYHPTWEEWRKEGEPGSQPVITWEPRKRMLRTDAYAEWMAAQEAEASGQEAEA